MIIKVVLLVRLGLVLCWGSVWAPRSNQLWPVFTKSRF